MSDSHYIHGTAPEEQERLTRMNDLLNDGSIEALALRGGERVLDLGCGLAQLTRAMARAAGSRGRVIGVERSPAQLAEARRLAADAGEKDTVELREGDVFSPPLRDDEWGSFDVAHARFVLEHVPEPRKVVEQMVRAVRPGGRIVLEDDDHDVLRLWPEPPGVAALWAAYMRSYDRLGNDPFVGRRLVSLLHEAGARPRRNRWLFFGACSGDPTFPPFVENLARIFEGARDALIEPGMIEPAAFDEAVRGLRAWGTRPDAAFWFARCWAEGVREA